jgi:hypothetical protein
MSFQSEWKLTHGAWRFTLLGLSGLFLIWYGGMALFALGEGKPDWCLLYLTVAILSIPLHVWWPFGIAAAARRRGHNFSRWLALSLVFGPLIMGLAYLVASSAWASSPPGADSAGERQQPSEETTTSLKALELRTNDPQRIDDPVRQPLPGGIGRVSSTKALYSAPRDRCECCNRACRTEHYEKQCTNKATTTLWRIDINVRDENGTRFCDPCADDAEARAPAFWTETYI